MLINRTRLNDGLNSWVFRIYLMMAVLFLEGLNAATTAGSSSGCPSCGMHAMVKGSEEQLLIEIAKQQILSKLHLKERPNITQTVPRPALLTALRKLHAGRVRQDGTLELENSPLGAHTKDQGYEIVSFADMTDADSSGSQPSLAFQFLWERGQSIQVLQSSLWLYIYSADTPIRDSRVTVQIYLSAQDAGNRTLLLRKGVEIQRGSWHTFAITRALQEFLDGGQPQLQMEVACRMGEQDLCMARGSTSSAHRPFLVTQVRLRKDESRHALQKRSLQCGDDVTVCCKKDFYVKFRDIKWQDWIIAPEGYHMNYCMGQCPHHLAGSPGIASSFHAAVFSQLKANGIETGVTSCCVPIKRRPLSMVHFDSPHSIVKTDIEDMIVESCGCT